MTNDEKIEAIRKVIPNFTFGREMVKPEDAGAFGRAGKTLEIIAARGTFKGDCYEIAVPVSMCSPDLLAHITDHMIHTCHTAWVEKAAA